MDTGHNDLLGELAADAALERSDFIVQATEQLRRFLDHHKDRIAVLGGLTLIDDEPDYLSIAPDLSFRSRSRYLDDLTGEWVSETEVIESASELVELYNPADIYAAFAEAAREAAGRSGIEAVQKSTVEAADSLGFNRLQIYRYVVLPLALRFCLPALNNNLVNLAKTTTQAYAIAVPETLFVASQIWSDRINVFEMMITLLTFYLILVGVLVWLMSRLERALRVPGFGQ